MRGRAKNNIYQNDEEKLLIANNNLHVLDFVVDVADWSVRSSALIRQRGAANLGRKCLDGDRGSVVETGLRQTYLQPGVRCQRFIHVPPATQEQQQAR